MSTTQVTAVLFQLQQLDLEGDRLHAEQQSITASLQGSDKLRKLRRECETARQHWNACLQTQKEAEWLLEDLDRRLKEQEKRLYAGNVNNAKELQAVQQEAQALRAQQSRQEDTLLELIDTAEGLAEVARQHSESLREAETLWEKERVELIGRREQVEARQQELQVKRGQITSTLDVELVKRYDTMRRTKQGRAISKVDQNSCQWCRVILTPSELQQVRISPVLQTCTNCGRILYYER
ncbi:zinc ribbon domain-containing protein [Tengunoibacter tsumagoiensis]|uniref:CT398-like coiled coil hairpin domain-containing protein n=1 Tax=Tengunoibacter tsumagoiensis TaxID=2014871 RepID=A0A401ZV01_9CHLR|nr:hypothetical protein [Tengunoibacter tsumagoiensis]GCE10632.1 hypothetical protein KTT_04910 [Tengunoibacter tsumagoiensis]